MPPYAAAETLPHKRVTAAQAACIAMCQSSTHIPSSICCRAHSTLLRLTTHLRCCKRHAAMLLLAQVLLLQLRSNQVPTQPLKQLLH